MPGGRPSDYSEEMVARICHGLANGLSMREICEPDDMPAMSTVFNWLAKHKEFVEKYARAREAQADYMAEEILEIADDARNDWTDRQVAPGVVRKLPDPEVVNRSKLRVEARKWLMSKLQPKKYGDKMVSEHTGPGGGELVFRWMTERDKSKS